MKKWKTIIIISIAIISILIAGTAHAGLIQGQVNQNGTLWIVSYQTPTGDHYPQPFAAFHANNLTLTVYSPLPSVQTANIYVKSYEKSTNETEWLNQSFTVMPHQVQTFDLKIPQVAGQQETSITWDNNTVVYLIQTYHPINFPFGNNPLGLLALIGIIMLIFTGINIGITRAILERAKYFPKLSQRAWAGIIIISALIIYNITTNYYYDLTGQDWALWLIPLWTFNLLMILSAYPGKAQDELMIHIRETQGNDLETGLYAIKTAPMSEKEKGKYPIEYHSGKEYIDGKSYLDFIKRLLGIRIPIIMETPQQPDKIENPKSLRIPRQGWRMKDRANKDHPFSEAILLDPLLPQPTIERIKIATGQKARRIKKKMEADGTSAELPEKVKKTLILRARLNGKHMKEAEYFLADYITASESGKRIHELSRDLAINQAALNTRAYDFQKELIDYMFEVQNKKRDFQNFKARTFEHQEEEKKKEGEDDTEQR
jgi:hypothetical protein